MSISFYWAVWGYLYSLGNPRRAPPSSTSLELILSHSPARLPKPHPRLRPVPGPSLCPPSGWDSSTAPQIQSPATAPPPVQSRKGCPLTTLPSGLGSAHKLVPAHSPTPRVGLSPWRWPRPRLSLALTKQTRTPRRRLGCKAAAPPATPLGTLTHSPATSRCPRAARHRKLKPLATAWDRKRKRKRRGGGCRGRSRGVAHCLQCEVFSAAGWVHVVRSALVPGSGFCERRTLPGLP